MGGQARPGRGPLLQAPPTRALVIHWPVSSVDVLATARRAWERYSDLPKAPQLVREQNRIRTQFWLPQNECPSGFREEGGGDALCPLLG